VGGWERVDFVRLLLGEMSFQSHKCIRCEMLLQGHRQTCSMGDTNLKRARETVAVKILKSMFNPFLSHSPSRKCLEWLLFSLILWHVFYSRPPTAFPLSPCSLPPSPS